MRFVDRQVECLRFVGRVGRAAVFPPTRPVAEELFDKLGDEARWEKNERKRLDDLDALDAIEASDDDEQAESEAEDHGIAPELQLTEADVDELARRDSERPSGFSFTDACAILGHPVPKPDLAESRQTAGVRCKDLR